MPLDNAPLDGGSIPACAGEPCTHPNYRPAERVYPRVCGGTSIRAVACVTDVGLSPRVRGNPPYLGGTLGTEGSIPACAGEPVLVDDRSTWT